MWYAFVRGGMRIKDPDIKESSLEAATPETICGYVEPGTIISVGSGIREHFTGDWL